MRYHEFKPLIEAEVLDELSMSPNDLQRFMTTDIGQQMRAGFEAELVFPNISYADEDNPEMDMTHNPDIRDNTDLDDIKQFFGISDYDRGNSAVKSMMEAYEDERNRQCDQYIEAGLDDEIEDIKRTLDDGEEIDKDDLVQQAQDSLREYYFENEEFTLGEFLRGERLRDMEDLMNEYGFDWQEWTSGNSFTDAMYRIDDDLEAYVDATVHILDDYHGENKNGTDWYLEPDTSIKPEGHGVEIVSPPLPVEEMLEKMETVFTWAKTNHNAQSNKSTGLHIGVSSINKIQPDYVKLALFLGDRTVLAEFGREANTYTKSAWELINAKAQKNSKTVDNAMELMRIGMAEAASKIIFAKNPDKYTSINKHDDYVEFRSMGGNYLEMLPQIKQNVMRFCQAYAVACDPRAYRQEYLKKLSKILNPGNVDELFPFVHYAVGMHTGDALAASNVSPDMKNVSNYALKKGLQQRNLVRKGESPYPVKPAYKPVPLPGTQAFVKKQLPKEVPPEPTEPWALWTVTTTGGYRYPVAARSYSEAQQRAMAENPELNLDHIYSTVKDS